MKQLMPQQCPVAFLYLTWAVYLIGLICLAVRGQYGFATGWAVAVPAALWLYVRLFPRLSPYLGYGRVDDAPASLQNTQAASVTMYGAVGCPFCPIVRRRLEVLRGEMGFDLEYVDVTVRPAILASKGIKSVPVVEVGERRIVGNATSEQLARLISEQQNGFESQAASADTESRGASRRYDKSV